MTNATAPTNLPTPDAVSAAATNAASEAAEWTEEFADGLRDGGDLLSAPARWFVEKGPEFAARAIVALVLLLAGWLAIRILMAVVSRVVRRSRATELMASFLENLCHKTLWTLLVIGLLANMGVDVSALLAGVGAVGFIVGFACKDALGNLAAGMMIALNRPFAAGDYVVLGGPSGDVQGTVKRLTMTMTELETPDGKRVVVPNGVAWGAPITNFSSVGWRRVDTAVSIAYGEDVEKAKKVLAAALAAIPEVIADPAPVVGAVSCADSGVVISCRSYCKADDYWTVYFAANQRMAEALLEAGVEIPFPHMVVHQA